MLAESVGEFGETDGQVWQHLEIKLQKNWKNVFRKTVTLKSYLQPISVLELQRTAAALHVEGPGGVLEDEGYRRLLLGHLRALLRRED